MRAYGGVLFLPAMLIAGVLPLAAPAVAVSPDATVTVAKHSPPLWGSLPETVAPGVTFTVRTPKKVRRVAVQTARSVRGGNNKWVTVERKRRTSSRTTFTFPSGGEGTGSFVRVRKTLTGGVHRVVPGVRRVSPETVPAPGSGGDQTTPGTPAPTLPPVTVSPVAGKYGVSRGWELPYLTRSELRRELDLYSQVGLRWVRMDLDWSDIEKVKGVYQWDKYDTVVAEANARNMKVLALPTYTPTWAQKHPEHGNKSVPETPAQYGTFVAAAAQHYTGNVLDVDAWEIWNEPNVSQFFAPKPDPVVYANMLRQASVAVRAVDPADIIVTGGVAPATTSSGGGSIAPETFLDAVTKNVDAEAYDAVGVHPYSYPALPSGGETWNTFSKLPQIRDMLAGNGVAGKRIWLTEFGVPTGESKDAMTDEGTALIVEDGVRLTMEWQEWLGPLFFYSVRDTGTNPQEREDNFGWVTREWEPKSFYPRVVETVQRVQHLPVHVPNPREYSTSVYDYGMRTDTEVLQRALSALQPGDTLTFPNRVLRHEGTLTVNTPHVVLAGEGEGSTLEAVNENRSSFTISADSVTVRNLTFSLRNVTKRWDAYEQMKVRLADVSGTVLSNVHVDGSAAAGVYIGGSDHFTIRNVTVAGTAADGVHITEGSHDGTVTGLTVTGAGDDGFAVVSYRTSPPCHTIRADTVTVSGQTWGRGLSVVGGRDVHVSQFVVRGSPAASVYVASESEFSTWGVSNVVFRDGTVVEANKQADMNPALRPSPGKPRVVHGALTVYSSAEPVSGVLFDTVTVEKSHPGGYSDVQLVDYGTTRRISGVGLRNIVQRSPRRVLLDVVGDVGWEWLK